MSAVPPPPQAAPGWGSTAPLGPAAVAGRTPAPTAVASVVAGVLGMTMVPVIGSIVALVLGYQSRNAARAAPDRYDDQLGLIGRVLGWVGLVWGLLWGIAMVAFFVIFVSSFMGSFPLGPWPLECPRQPA